MKREGIYVLDMKNITLKVNAPRAAGGCGRKLNIVRNWAVVNIFQLQFLRAPCSRHAVSNM